jgi:diguanylate cyclase (GGDEF)-like protein/PAS domain S-box-containing protein
VQVVSRQFADNGISLFETRHRRKDGSLLDVEVTGYPLEMEGRKVLYNSARDITLRKLSETELSLYRDHLEKLVEERTAELSKAAENMYLFVKHAPISIAMFDCAMNYLAASDRWLAEYGHGNSDLVGRNYYDVHPKGGEKWRVIHQRGLAGETIKNDEDLWFKADGSRHWLRWAVLPWTQPGGSIGGIIVSAEDITERKGADEERQTSEARFRLLASATFEGIAMTEDGRFVDANEQLLHMLGYAREELLGRPVEALLLPEDRDRVLHNILHRRESQIEHAMVCQDGRHIQVEARGQNLERMGHTIRITALRDITARKQAEELLRIAATAFESQEGMMVTDADGIILRVNRSFTEITGYSAEEMIGCKPSRLQSGRHNAAFYAEMWKNLRHQGVWQGEIWNRRKNGEIYPEWLTITAVKGEAGEVTHFVGTLIDNTLRKAAEDEIRHLAFYDPLTSLPNRRLLQDRLRQALASSMRSGHEGALLFIDLDNFKTLNDTLGHHIGDQLLLQVAERLSGCVRESDTVARLGGDEFVVMLDNLSEHMADAATQAEFVGRKIISSLNQPYLLAGNQHFSTPSVGAALFNKEDDSVDDLLKRADLAMYQAKAAGRNTLRFFDPEMQAAVTARAALEAKLRVGLQRQEFSLYYQCQVDMVGNMTGAEALVRWKDPQRGMVSPAEFIPLAEQTGLILPLGKWILTAACAQLSDWSTQPETAHLHLAVNVSALQFHHPDFVDHVLSALRQSGANPQRLKLEVTESVVLDHVEDIIDKMNALKSEGVSFSLDDFGTGYSSLSYLKRLPLDQLKIDQSFVRDIHIDQNDAAITRAIIALAQSMGLGVIAEGVETDDQRSFLVRQGCDAFQGYLFSRPLPIEEFNQLVRTIEVSAQDTA